MAKRLTDAERKYIEEHFEQLGPSECARRVGCSRSTARRIGQASSGVRQKDAPKRPAPEASKDTDLGRLVELRGILRAALNDAPPAAVAGLAREYRATIEQIERITGGDNDDPVGCALDSIAARIAAKMPAA